MLFGPLCFLEDPFLIEAVKVRVRESEEGVISVRILEGSSTIGKYGDQIITSL